MHPSKKKVIKIDPVPGITQPFGVWIHEALPFWLEMIPRYFGFCYYAYSQVRQIDRYG